MRGKWFVLSVNINKKSGEEKREERGGGRGQRGEIKEKNSKK